MANLLKEDDNQPIDINVFVKNIVDINDKIDKIWKKVKNNTGKQKKAYLSLAQEAEEYYKNNNNIYGTYEHKGKRYPPQSAHDFYNCVLMQIYYYALLDSADERLKNPFLKCKASNFLNIIATEEQERIVDNLSKEEEPKEDEKSPEPSKDKPPTTSTPATPVVSFVAGDSVYYKKKPELGFFVVSKILSDGKMTIKDKNQKELTVNMNSYAKKGQ